MFIYFINVQKNKIHSYRTTLQYVHLYNSFECNNMFNLKKKRSQAKPRIEQIEIARKCALQVHRPKRLSLLFVENCTVFCSVYFISARSFLLFHYLHVCTGFSTYSKIQSSKIDKSTQRAKNNKKKMLA